MIKLSINCDFCNTIFESTIRSYPGDLLQSYKELKGRATEKGWVYHTSNKRLYCPNCAAYRNAYEGELSSRNRNNNPGWHYVNPEGVYENDVPEMVNGVSMTVINQDGDEVFWGNCGWLYADPEAAKRAGSSYAKVYRWRLK